MNFCKDCKYHDAYCDAGYYYGNKCHHPSFRKFDYVSGNIVHVPECNTIRRYEPECKLFEKEQTFWEWFKSMLKGIEPL